MSQIKECNFEEDLSCDMTELMDLPELVLLHIFSYFDHDFLRHTAPRVCMEWKRLAQSQVFWAQASLHLLNDWCLKKVNDTCVIMPGVDVFVRDIIASPYLQHLSVTIDSCDEGTKSAVLEALLSTSCRLHGLSLSVEQFSPEIVQFLQQHPEIRELKLGDKTMDNNYAAGVAAIVGCLIPRLISLNLSDSLLVHMPKAGLLLTSPSNLHEDHMQKPVESSMFPEGSVPQEPPSALDLLNVDDDCDVKEDQPQGLQHLEFFPSSHTLNIDPFSLWASSTAKNLSSLIHAQKHSLTSVKVWLPIEDVWIALGECEKLEELWVHCDRNGSGFCAMLQSMQSTLRRLHIELGNTLSSQELATVFRTLCRHAPRLESLELSGRGTLPFPGFKPLEPLLFGNILRELRLIRMRPVGRAQLLELASMATANGSVSLRKLVLKNCLCSADFSQAECRQVKDEVRQASAEDTVRAGCPSLEYYSLTSTEDDDDGPFDSSCDCNTNRDTCLQLQAILGL